jgi:uncharacterized protein (TIGR03086 family)
MRIQDLFLHSNIALAGVVEQIDAEQWALELSPGPSRSPQNLRVTIGYYAYDDAWVPDVLAGRTAAEVGDRFEHLLDPSDARAAYREQNRRASAEVAEFDDLRRIVHLSYGDFPAEEFLQHITSFRFVRAWDIAGLIGTRPDFSEEFLLAVQSEFAPHMDQYRSMGIFPTPIEVAADADPLTRVMASFGRL